MEPIVSANGNSTQKKRPTPILSFVVAVVVCGVELGFVVLRLCGGLN
jgi:hypothetical protein